MVFKIKDSAMAGDWSYLRFDQTGNNFLDVTWNKKSPDNITADTPGSVADKYPSAKGNGTEDNTGSAITGIQLNNDADYLVPVTKRVWMDAWNTAIPAAAVIDGVTLTVEYWEDNAGADCDYASAACIQYTHNEFTTTYNSTLCPVDTGHTRTATSVALPGLVGKTGTQMNEMDMRFTNSDADCPLKFDYWFVSVRYHTVDTAWDDLYSGTPPCDNTKCFCWRTNSTGPVDCPDKHDNLNLVIWNRKEVGNPYLPPGWCPISWLANCPNAPASNPTQGNICGGRQVVVGVVCVQ